MSWKLPDRRSTHPLPLHSGMSPAVRPRSTTISLEARKVLEGFDLDATLSPGARNVVDGHLRIGTQENVTLLCDAGEEPLARAMLEALDEVGASTTVYLLAHTQPESETVANRVAATLATSEAAIYVLAEMPKEGSARSRWIAAGRGSRQVLLAGVSPTVARQSLRASPHELARVSAGVASRIANAKSIEVRTATGTNLVVRLSPGTPVRVEDGRVGEGLAVPTLPAGEVLIATSHLEGQVVADGGVWLDGRTPLGIATRIVLTFVDGRLSDIRGPEAERVLAYFEENRISRSVAAVGFGTNTSVLTPVRELAQDARMTGFHLVLGRLRDLEDLTSPRVHVLVRRPDVRCDSTTIVANGRIARDITE